MEHEKPPLPPEEVDEIYNETIIRAQEIARKEGLEIGQTVAHPSEDMTYVLKEIKGDQAVVWIPDQKNSVKQFPLNELFDPNIAEKIGRQKGAQEALNQNAKEHPEKLR